jgi:hypothetical protein
MEPAPMDQHFEDFAAAIRADEESRRQNGAAGKCLFLFLLIAVVFSIPFFSLERERVPDNDYDFYLEDEDGNVHEEPKPEKDPEAVFYRQEAEEKRLQSMEPRPVVYSKAGQVGTKPVYSEDDDVDTREAPERPRTIREMVYADSDSTVDLDHPGPSVELVPVRQKTNLPSAGPASPPSPYVPRRKGNLPYRPVLTTAAGLDSGEETVCLSFDSSDSSFDEDDVDRVEVVYRNSRKRKVVTWWRHICTDSGSDTGGESGKRYREARERRKKTKKTKRTKRTKRMKRNNRKCVVSRDAFPFAIL